LIESNHVVPKAHKHAHESEGRPNGPRKKGIGHWEDDLFLFLAVFIISIALKLQARFKETEKAKLAAELAYLKSQINPHFLFNTLNSIYSLALKKSDDTANAIVKLSGMMRYNITDAQSEFIEIEKEIDYITSYIELQKIRLGETAKVNFAVNGIADKHQIAPLLLISFIENAFKYGVNPEIESFIQITIGITNNTVELKVYNKIVPVNIVENTKTGTGIANVIRRLDLLYSGKYQLQISHTETDYTVTLIITIK
jgi:LytS/YehU family sensor histidine kinase